MPVPEYGGCLWPVDAACLTEKWNALTQPEKDRALALASATLTRLTGGRVGGCPVTVRPEPQTGLCRVVTGFDQANPSAPFAPVIGAHGEWRNCGMREKRCEVNLPGPVTRLVSVTIDGTEQDLADFQVLNSRTLSWLGQGECPIPQTQVTTLPATEPGTFEVVYYNTYPVDSIGAYAAGLLAMEYAKACAGEKCALPANVTAISRAGVSYEIAAGGFPNGTTGIRQVDAFIALWNPRAQKQASTVWSPTNRPGDLRTS